jgi:hypothetical protein
MTKWRAFKVLMVCRVTNIARHSVVKDEADKGALLEYLIERLGMKKEYPVDNLATDPSVKTRYELG